MSAPPGLTVAAARASSRACSSARRGTSDLRRRQRRSARDASVPRPLHGASRSTASKAPSNAAGSSSTSAVHDVDAGAPRRARFSRSSPTRASSTSTAVTAVSGKQRRELARLGPRRGAEVEEARRPARPPRRRRPCRRSASPCDCGVTSPSRNARRALERRAVVEQPVRQPGDAAGAEAVGGQRLWRRGSPPRRRFTRRQRSGAALPASRNRSAGSVAELVAQQLDQPRRVREPQRPGARVIALAQLRELGAPLGGHAPQDGVGEAAGPPAPARRQRHGVVDGGVGRDAVQEEQLERRQPQGVAHVGVGGAERRLGEGAEDGVEGSAPLDGAADQLVRQAAVAAPRADELRQRGRRTRRGGCRGARSRRSTANAAARAGLTADGAAPRPRRRGRSRSREGTGRRHAGTRRPSSACGPPAAARARPASRRRRRRPAGPGRTTARGRPPAGRARSSCAGRPAR